MREAFQKEIVPIPSETHTIDTISKYSDSEYWLIFLPPYLLV